MRNPTADITSTQYAKVNSRRYCNRALSVNPRANFSGAKTPSSIPRTLTLTGLRSRNFSKPSPQILSLAPGAFPSCGTFPCKPLSPQNLRNHESSHLYRDEDKLLQGAVTRLLEAIYEQAFLPCSYGY